MLASWIALFLICGSLAAFAEVRLVGDLPRKDEQAAGSLPGLETEYGVVRTSEGVRLRTIITRPAGSDGQAPGDLSHPRGVVRQPRAVPADRLTRSRRTRPASGMVLVRVERAGDGDSEGVRLQRARLRHRGPPLSRSLRPDRPAPWVDPDRIVIFGSSLGSTTAPLVAQGKKVAGIVVQGGGAVTYLERMINFDRLYLERSGKYRPDADPRRDDQAHRLPSALSARQETPEQIERERPDLAGRLAESIRGGAEAPPHYGRPYAWHQQAAEKNFLAAWTKIEAPVLVALRVEYDQFEPRAVAPADRRHRQPAAAGHRDVHRAQRLDHSI